MLVHHAGIIGSQLQAPRWFNSVDEHDGTSSMMARPLQCLDSKRLRSERRKIQIRETGIPGLLQASQP